MRAIRLSQALSFLALGLVLAGCGGGGGGANSNDPGTGATTGTTSLFITDSLDDRDHVWVTIKRVSLVGANGEVSTYDDATGTTVDLKTLRDASGERYSFLSNAPAGTYTGLRITVARTARVFGGGASNGQARDFAGAAGGDAVLSLTFAAPKTLANGSALTVDFDLASWSDDGATLTGAPFLREGRGDGLGDLGRHENEDYRGTISTLSGAVPDQSFTLSRGGRTVRVVTDAATSLFNGNGAASPTLANGSRVEVRGAFSSAQGALVASAIKIEDGAGQHGPELRGAASAIDAAAGTFTLSVRSAEGFLPAGTAIRVTVASGAAYRGRRGTTATRDEFFAALAASGFAEVEGSYDADANVFTATRLKAENSGDGSHGEGDHSEAEFRGPASAVDAAARAFSITVRRWEGANVASGTVVRIVTTSATEFRGRSGGNGIGAEAFFAALANGGNVEAEGAYDPATRTLTAAKARIENSDD